MCIQVEVPLLYYFPGAEKAASSQDRARAFVYEVRNDPADPTRQIVEIVVRHAVLYVIVRPLSTVEYTNLIHDSCSGTLFTLSSVSSSACLFHAWKVSSRGESVSGWLDVSTQA